MASIPEDVMEIVNDPKTAKTISTRSPDGRIHTIYMGSLIAPSPDELMFAHILTKRTHKNLENMKNSGDLVSVSVTLEQASYEIMATVGDYQTSGPKVERMIEELRKLGVMDRLKQYGMKVYGIWTLIPQETWEQSPGPRAGTKIE